MTKKKGFVFIETIVVVAVLTVSLIMTYSTYNSSIMKEKTRTFYDDPVYLYRTFYLTKFFREYSLDLIASNLSDNNYISPFSCQNDGIFVENPQYGKAMCETLWRTLNVEAVFLTYNDLSSLQDNTNNPKKNSVLAQVDEDTANYLKTIGGNEQVGYRIIVKYSHQKNGVACEEGKNCISYYTTLSLGEIK